jgi:hypothetical protein
MLNAFPITVVFNQDIELSRVESLATEMESFGHIERSGNERTFAIYVLRNAEMSRLEVFLASLTRLGLALWRDCSTVDTRRALAG